MLRSVILALALTLSSGFVLTPRPVPARASVRMGGTDNDTPKENYSNTPGVTPNFSGGSFADYLAAQQQKKEEDEKKKD